jgi:hypothetical protein
MFERDVRKMRLEEVAQPTSGLGSRFCLGQIHESPLCSCYKKNTINLIDVLLDLAALHNGAKGISQFRHDHFCHIGTTRSRDITVAHSVLGDDHIVSKTCRVAGIYQYNIRQHNTEQAYRGILPCSGRDANVCLRRGLAY